MSQAEFEILLAALAWLYIAGVIVVMINEDRDPTTTLAWILFLVLLPGLGIVLYFLIGRDWTRIGRTARALAAVRDDVTQALDSLHARYASYTESAWRRWDGTLAEKAMRMVQAQGHAAPLPADSVEIYPAGELAFASLKDDLRSAKDFIHLQYFIWEHDVLTSDIIQILIDKLGEGVEVRLMYDFLGSVPYRKDEIRRLRAAGASAVADVTRIRKINYRNHRKMALIDGHIAHTGGINVGQEYIDGKPKYPMWRDTNIRITGPFVASMQVLFATGWWVRVRENLFGERYYPMPDVADPDGALTLQLAHTSVESKWHSISQTYALAISGASERVWLQSPYFVPDEPLYASMLNAALAGTDVRLMITGWPDHKTAWWAAHSYFGKFLEAGGRVFLFEDGFMHAKTMTVDQTFASIGTSNLDTRSLQLHDELTVFIFDPETTRRQDEIFEHDLESCREITLKDLEDMGGLTRFRNSLARLLSKVV